MKDKDCFISGPITNDPDFFNKFAAAEYEVYSLGLRPVNPARLVPINQDWTWEQYMREDLKHLLNCQNIYMLRGWQDSYGAKIELNLANTLKMNVIMQSAKAR